MNGRFQMQGGKNWIFATVMNANRFFWDSHCLEIWSNHFCPSMGPNGGSVAMDSVLSQRVGRVLSFFSSRRNWDSPNPSPAGECAPPPVLGGGAPRGTLACEKGVGRVPVPTRGHTLSYSLYIRTLWSFMHVLYNYCTILYLYIITEIHIFGISIKVRVIDLHS
jgi:hypothetical protein